MRKSTMSPRTAISTLAMSLAVLTIPAAAAVGQATQSRDWPAETLSGRIEMVEPAQRVVIVETQDKVPLDMVIGPKTHIKHSPARS